MFCSNCGKEISDNQNFCNYCGTKVITNNNSNENDIKLNETELTNKILENKDNISNAVNYVIQNKNLDQPNARKYVDKVLKDNGVETNNSNSSQNISSQYKSNMFSRLKKILILIIIALFVFKFLMPKMMEHIYSDEYTGKNLAEQYFENHSAFGSVNASYMVGKFIDFYSSKLIKQDINKYIFEVKFLYHPMLNNGTTDLTKEDEGKTYVVYNTKTSYFNCYASLQSAEKSDIWNE